MPKRSRSHRLEDISCVEFRKLIPDAWVCRAKSHDYGVDQEVEIFDEEGNSTGLIFHVQLKATDKVDKERSVRMKMDHLQYLASLDAPSVLVRYCEATGATHFMWISNVLAQLRDFSAGSTTINFNESDAWIAETPIKLMQTVKVYRKLRSYSRSLPLGLTVDDDGRTDSYVFEVKLAVAKLIDMSNMIVAGDNQDQCLPIVLRIRRKTVTASIDVVESVTWETDSFASNKILPELAYALAFMAGCHDFHRQADDLTRIIQAKEFTTSSRILASRVAQSAIGDPNIAASIARRNGLHSLQDWASIEYLNALLSSEVPREQRKLAVENFYHDSISAHDPEEKNQLSTLYYSLANFQMNLGSYTESVCNYNLARKFNMAYLRRPYFLNEFAACCFFRCRFNMAARLYRESYGIAPDTQVGICLGDALVYSGNFIGAREVFENLLKETDEYFRAAEIGIKAWLSSWLNEFYRLKNLSGTALLNDRAFWFGVIDQAIEGESDFFPPLAQPLWRAFYETTMKRFGRMPWDLHIVPGTLTL